MTVSDTGCWIVGRPDQYHQITVDGITFPTHRWMYQRYVLKKLLDPSMHVHHVCEVPGCINPAHLRAVTPWEHKGIHNDGHPDIYGINKTRGQIGPDYDRLLDEAS